MRWSIRPVAREAVIIKTLRERSPIVETYIQNMRPDPVMGQTVDSDAHFLARVDFGKVIGENGFLTGNEAKQGRFKHSLGYITGLSKPPPQLQRGRLRSHDRHR